MFLYSQLKTNVTVDWLLNDSLLHLGGYVVFADLAERHRLSTDSANELVSILAYWQGQHDAAPSQAEKDIVWVRMSLNLAIGFNGAERDVIDAADFAEIVGLTTNATRNFRVNR